MALDPNAPTLALDPGDGGPDGAKVGEWVQYVPTEVDLKESGLAELAKEITVFPAMVTGVYDAETVVLRAMPNPELTSPFEVKSASHTNADEPEAGGWYRASESTGKGGRGDSGPGAQPGA